MSVVASRQLLDQVAPLIEHIFVLHDCDYSGFSIFGTLFTDSRRYTFENDVTGKIVDIGLRLTEVAAMNLGSEPVKIKDEERQPRRLTLLEHGASVDEVEFLIPRNGECRRVELNAMTSRQLVNYVEAALQRHGVKKVMPDAATLGVHARYRMRVMLINAELAAIADDIDEEVAAAKLSGGLVARVRQLLESEPALSWDQAVTRIIG